MFEAEVTVEWKFSHYLEGFEEKFAKPHEHTWQVILNLAVPDLDNRGVSVDFVKLKQKVIDLLVPYQNKFLNESNLPFAAQPTAEHMALWVADNLNQSYPGMIHSVTVGGVGERARFLIPSKNT